ncbi:MAG: twitching motility protein PilU [Candidatus Azotimanducaceae bacterium]
MAQQLIPTIDGKGRCAAIEVLINTPLVADNIRKGEVHTIKDIMSKSTEMGMQTFDQALYALYATGEISYDNALASADSANDLRLMIKLAGEGPAIGSGAAGLSLETNESDVNLRRR